MGNIAVEFKDLSESYDIEIIREGKSAYEKLLALQGICLAIKGGESVAVIGPNGAGKTTLLKIIAGLLKPDRGEVRICGRVGSLLELGAGFHSELTGRDNLFLNASLYNFSREEINHRFQEILDFSGIGKFIDAPVKCYSQGMYVRLAFSLAIHVDPDILLIDDCLAVGDEDFQVKCIDKTLELREKGKAIVFVTHDMSLAREVCERGIFLRSGKIIKDAAIGEAIASYAAPLEIDRETYKYLGAKRQREEDERKEEERKKKQREEDEERKRIMLKVQERKKRAEERIRIEEEIKNFCCGALKIKFDLGRIRIYYNDTEVTSDLGLHTIFTAEDDLEYSSNSTLRRVRKISDTERICYFKWRNSLGLFQVWRIKLEEDAIDLEIIMQKHNKQFTSNERIELSLSGQYESAGLNNQNNKAKALTFRGNPDITFQSLQENQISGIHDNLIKSALLYFLNVPGRVRDTFGGKKLRYTYFKGKIYFGRKTPVSASVMPNTQMLKMNNLKAVFENGSLHILWKEKPLTKCLGAYSSICAKNVWHDSTQAIWEIKQTTAKKIIAEGFWPWVPVSQLWEINLEKENVISWNIEMEVYRKTVLDIEEAALMLSDDYTLWLANQKSGEFAQEFTSNDLFRYCLWNGKCDGNTSIGVESSLLPRIIFRPEHKEKTNLIIENSAHIYNTKSRLLHCMSITEDVKKYQEPGRSGFFRGLITVREEKI